MFRRPRPAFLSARDRSSLEARHLRCLRNQVRAVRRDDADAVPSDNQRARVGRRAAESHYPEHPTFRRRRRRPRSGRP